MVIVGALATGPLDARGRFRLGVVCRMVFDNIWDTEKAHYNLFRRENNTVVSRS